MHHRDGAEFAVAAVGDDLAQQRVGVEEPVVLGHDHLHVVGFGGGDDALRFLQAAREGLFDDHVLAGGDGLFHIRRVEMAPG